MLETYTGTIIFKTLFWMFKAMGVEVKLVDGIGRITFKGNQPIREIMNRIKEKDWFHEELLPHVSEKEMSLSKYVPYIPEELRLKMHAAHEFDIINAKKFLETYEIIELKLNGK